MSGHNPYGAPAGATLDDDPNLDDPSASRPKLISQFAGITALMAGATLATGAVQLSTLFYLRTGETVTAALMLGVGVALLGFGPAAMKARHGATWLVAGLALVGGLLTGGWWIYAFVYGGTLSALLMFGVPMCALAFTLSAVATGPAARVTAARARLYE